MITISAFSHVPDVAKGLVRDLRVRWALEEARLAYRVRLLEQGEQNKPEYRALQRHLGPDTRAELFELRRPLKPTARGAIDQNSPKDAERCGGDGPAQSPHPDHSTDGHRDPLTSTGGACAFLREHQLVVVQIFLKSIAASQVVAQSRS